MDTTLTISSLSVITILLSIAAWLINKLTKQQEDTNHRNEVMTDKILQAIDALRETIGEIRISISNINKTCSIKHDSINSRLKGIEKDTTELYDNINKLDKDVAVLNSKQK